MIRNTLTFREKIFTIEQHGKNYQAPRDIAMIDGYFLDDCEYRLDLYVWLHVMELKIGEEAETVDQFYNRVRVKRIK